jgi:hypothetical protein
MTELHVTEFLLSEILYPGWDPLPKWSLSPSRGWPTVEIYEQCGIRSGRNVCKVWNICPQLVSFISNISANCVLNYVCSNIYTIVVMGLCYLCCMYIL